MTKTDVKFIHIRQVNTHYTYDDYFDHFGGQTVAFKINADKNQVEYAIATVSMKDRYNRKIGRQISTEHLNKAPRIINVSTLAKFLPINPKSASKLQVEDFNWSYIRGVIEEDMYQDGILKVETPVS